jgi:hypothetical protein
VIVGATAMELRDSMAVPVHGIVTGSVLQMLAAETLLQQRVPLPTGELVTGALSLALLFVLAVLSIRLRLSWFLIAILMVAASVEVPGSGCTTSTPSSPRPYRRRWAFCVWQGPPLPLSLMAGECATPRPGSS